MTLASRITSLYLKSNSGSAMQVLRRLSPSRSFLSIARSEASSKSRPSGEKMIRGNKGYTNCLERFGASKRYYSREGSARNPKPPFPSVDRASFLIPGFVLAGIGGLAWFLHYNDEKRAVPKGKGEKFERRSNQGPIIGGPFSLVDTKGQVVTEKNLLGNWVLMYFGYTSSPDVGPAEVQKMANVINTLESKQKLKVLPIFVTIDPQRDTPSQLSAYLNEYDSRIVGLTGPVSAIRQMAQEYRVFFRKVDEDGEDYLVESSHSMYLLNPDMVVVRSIGIEYSAEELMEAIEREMTRTKTTISQN